MKYLDENGLKYLWSKIETKMESLTKEIVMISLSTNQGGGVTTTVTMTVDGNPTIYEYNNSPITISIPAGSQYTIQLGTIENYYTPTDSNTYTAVAGTTNNLSYTYSASLVTADKLIEYHNNENSTNTVSSSDVVMAISEDGSTIYTYCYDHYANVLCGYSSR